MIQQPSGGGIMESSPGFGKRVMSVLRAVYRMLRRGLLCRKRLMMDLHLLLGRGNKLAGRALRNLVASAHHHPHAAAHHHLQVASRRGCDGLDFAQVARALEMMSAAAESATGGAGGETPPASSSVAASWATPSPMLALSLGRSPAGARQLRVTDSPFPIEPEGGVVDERANSNFDAFINKFYENLRLQAANATPDDENHVRRRRG